MLTDDRLARDELISPGGHEVTILGPVRRMSLGSVNSPCVVFVWVVAWGGSGSAHGEERCEEDERDRRRNRRDHTTMRSKGCSGNTSTRGVDVEGMVVVRVEVWVWRVSVIAPEHRGEYSQMGWLRSQWKTAWYRTAGMGSVFTALFAVLLL